jgi:hypothetical protein
MLLLASRVTAASCAVAPTWILGAAGDTTTDATGTGVAGFTVTLALPTCPSLDAEIVTVPAVRAVTRPDTETVPIAVLLELHVMERPLSTLLLASRVTAESCTVPPIWRLAVEGDTETDATGTGAGATTLKGEDAVLPSLEADIMTVPGATAATSPLWATEATVEFEVCQVRARPRITFPVESMSVAVACAV